MRQLLLSLLVFSLAACESGGGGATDAALSDATTDDAIRACGTQLVEVDYMDLGQIGGFGDRSPAGNHFYYHQLDEATRPDFLVVELYAQAGAFDDGPVRTGTFEISGPETNYRTCGVCVLLYVNQDPEDIDGDGMPDFGQYPEQFYLAQSGTLQVTSLEGNITGRLTNATFRHVEIDLGGDDPTYESTILDDCASSIDDAQFSAAIEDDIPPIDAGLADAAIPDAAIPDATATPDAAMPDAAIPDAAIPDAAIPDAAVPDALINLPDVLLP
jgi:hypothetical protein